MRIHGALKFVWILTLLLACCAKEDLPSTTAPANKPNTEQARLIEERQKLGVLNERLGQLKSQLEQQEQQTELNTPARISENEAQIEVLQNLLQQNRGAETETTREGLETQHIQSQFSQAEQVQLDNEISRTKEQLQFLQEIYQEIQMQPPASAAELENQIAILQDQRNDLLQTLNELRNRKNESAQNWISSAQAVNEITNQRRLALVENESTISNQIETLERQNVQLENQRRINRVSSQSLTAQIKQAEEAFNRQKKIVEELESSK